MRRATLTRINLDTEGRVTGVDEQQFQAFADEAKRVCPVSRALAGIPEIVVTAKLAAARDGGGPHNIRLDLPRRRQHALLDFLASKLIGRKRQQVWPSKAA